ncbi:hypothetical protein [Rhodococcus spongiicola]|nr:hypothetical protein [Rhodococcus spongiicola]
MSVDFLNATATLLTDLLNNVYSGSLIPGVDFFTGSLVEATAIS